MRIACLLLAAGTGKRFGGCKQLALIDGKPMILRSLGVLAPLFAENLFTVLGAYREDIHPLIGDLSKTIDHENWQQGLGSTIAHGASRIQSDGDFDGILVTLADQYRLRQQDFIQLIERFDGQNIVCAHYSDSIGVPAIFPKSMFDQLIKLSGDRGAKKMLQKMEAFTTQVPLPMAAFDIDTVADLSKV